MDQEMRISMDQEMGTRMDQDTAQVLFEEGAILVFLDMPEGSEFGMDFSSWTVGPKFRGMKMIPPGLHFVYYSAVSRDQQAGPRSGFFHHFSQQEVVVKRWDERLEDVKPDVATPEELLRFAENKREMDRYLAPYPYDSYKKWVSLTKHITSDVAHKLQPECGYVCSMAQFVSEPSTSESRKRDAETEAMEGGEEGGEGEGEESRDRRRQHGSLEDCLPKMEAVQGTKIRYTAIPQQKYPHGSSPAEITKFSMDSSFQLDLMLKDRYSDNPGGILGEVQFAFVCFLIGQNYDSFEQWKWLVRVLCTSDSSLLALPGLFVDFIAVLHFQVRQIPADFFVDIVSQSNFLTATLQEFFSNLESLQADSVLRSRGLKFRQHLTEKFDWDFTSEPDDDAPVVVECRE